LNQRMATLGPNLKSLLGTNIAAKLISHSGSLINLAKTPASTIQLIGAEKALFRALKTRVATPKYGVVFHADMVVKAGNNKAKMARMLSAKAALCARVDALGEDEVHEVADEYKDRLHRSAKYWDVAKQLNRGYSDFKRNAGTYIPAALAPKETYKTAMDTKISVKRSAEDDEEEQTEQPKKKKRKLEAGAEEVKTEEAEEETAPTEKKTPKKKKKKSKTDEAVNEEETPKKKKIEDEAVNEEEAPKKKKKKSKAKDD